MFRHTLVEIASRTASRLSAFAAAGQEDNVVADDFCHVTFLIGLLVLPRAGLQLAFYIDLAALFQVLTRDLGQPLPEDDIVPLGAVLPLAFVVLGAVGGGDGELGYGRAAGRVFDLGVLTEIAEKNDLVNAFGHESTPGGSGCQIYQF